MVGSCVRDFLLEAPRSFDHISLVIEGECSQFSNELNEKLGETLNRSESNAAVITLKGMDDVTYIYSQME